MAHVTACAINTFYTRSPELIDSRIVRSPALFLSDASFSITCRQRLGVKKQHSRHSWPQIYTLHLITPYTYVWFSAADDDVWLNYTVQRLITISEQKLSRFSSSSAARRR